MKPETKEIIKTLSMESIAMILIFIAGFIFGNVIINDDEPDAIGLYFSNADKPFVEESINNDYAYTDWVCMDITRQDYSEAMETCQHEVAHYIFKHETPKEDYTREDSEEFARKCEKILVEDYK